MQINSLLRKRQPYLYFQKGSNPHPNKGGRVFLIKLSPPHREDGTLLFLMSMEMRCSHSVAQYPNYFSTSQTVVLGSKSKVSPFVQSKSTYGSIHRTNKNSGAVTFYPLSFLQNDYPGSVDRYISPVLCFAASTCAITVHKHLNGRYGAHPAVLPERIFRHAENHTVFLTTDKSGARWLDEGAAGLSDS